MTREEATERFNGIINAMSISVAQSKFFPSKAELNELCDMAIEALKILGDDGIVNCCGCIHWKTDGGAMMMCELWDTPMGDFDYCSYGKRKGGDAE